MTLKQPTINKRAAIYARVSTKDQDCSRQIADLTGFAERYGLVTIFTAKETASGARNDRYERRKLMKLAQEGRIEYILVTELSRWGRSLTDLVSTVKELEGYGVILWPMNQAPIDSTSPTGKIILTVFGMMAEFERDLIRERVLSGLAAARAKGKQLGRRPGSGKTIKENSKQVIDLHQQEYSNRSIARKLKIGATTVQTILKASQKLSNIDDLL